MKNMSFMLTIESFLDGSKDVTRRLGWSHLNPGDHFMAVEKSMGLKKGEKVHQLSECVCISNNREPLNSITQEECNREGFAHLQPSEFVEMFCKEIGTYPEVIINRIQFKKVIP